MECSDTSEKSKTNCSSFNADINWIKENHEIICSDRGLEFSGAYKTLCKKHNIRQIYTKSIHKAAVAERFIRTLKEKFYRVLLIKILKTISKIYNPLLSHIIAQFIDQLESRLKIAYKSNELKIATRLYGDILSVDNPIIFNFNIRDYVRIPIGKKLFDKGFTQKWSSDMYVFIQKIPTNPP